MALVPLLLTRMTLARCTGSPQKSRNAGVMTDFGERLFCGYNRSTAWERRGPPSRVLFDRCLVVQALSSASARHDPHQLDVRHIERCESVAGYVRERRSPSRSDTVGTEQAPFVDESTAAGARRRHCGLPDMPWNQLSSRSRAARAAIKDALLCGRSALSPIYRGAGVTSIATVRPLSVVLTRSHPS
ncbi:hypothetical protein pqer_cds_666 [Pandoravirus quercus]|uniref:Uncharacterized protein n=1 Tax=Pandoravirus quercus TaxID=2107709 RepID=A0A2U7U9G1_9VIRU|nr:hypothetical protein pqer_cds_666 [Pandoravirus quercus]AVK75088.1 hypothetical protein pqer_cds_666 [Pandoravirus quercus]